MPLTVHAISPKESNWTRIPPDNGINAVCEVAGSHVVIIHKVLQNRQILSTGQCTTQALDFVVVELSLASRQLEFLRKVCHCFVSGGRVKRLVLRDEAFVLRS